MDDNTQQRNQALEEKLARAGAFEVMVKTKGWELLQAFYQNQVQQFAGELLLNPEQPIEQLEGRRQRLVGLRMLMAEVDDALSTLTRFREEQRGKAATADSA